MPERRLKQLVLVIEDDPGISLGLRINLEKEGYEVLLAQDGEEGLELINRKSPDLVLLDVMLPKKNGFEVLHSLRSAGHVMPVIVLSARTSEMDKVAGLELGAEDYVAKPFGLAELLARVRAALRRAQLGSQKQNRTLHFGDIVVDIDAREVQKAGEKIEFTATEFDVLLCLMQSSDKALSREVIFRTVWGPGHHGTPRTVDNFLQQLRAKLEDDPSSPRFFHTVRGIGYRFSSDT